MFDFQLNITEIFIGSGLYSHSQSHSSKIRDISSGILHRVVGSNLNFLAGFCLLLMSTDGSQLSIFLREVTA